jgi:two-component system, NtrC family, nitrogen regulation response regulator GlnG
MRPRAPGTGFARQKRMSSGAGRERFDDMVTTALPSLVSEATRAGGRVYRSVMARMELPLLRHALELCGGNQLKAAKLLGINRNTLRKRLRMLGLLPPAGTNGSNAKRAATG